MQPLVASLKNGWKRASDDDIGLIAAGIAYYGFLSLVPLLAGAILTYGLVVDPQTIAEHGARVARQLPGAAGELVSGQLRSVAASRGGTHGLGLVLALGAALFGARVAAGALIQALDMAFDSKDERGFIMANVMALAITVVAVIVIGVVAGITALAATMLNGVAAGLVSIVMAGLAGFGGALLSYRVLPKRPSVTWASARRGATLFAIGWLIVSAGFGFYASNFGNYNATYGSLGAVVVFLTWVWLSAWLLLLGAHIAAASLSAKE